MALAIAKPFVVLVSICVCTLLVTPSEKFNSAAVAVTSTEIGYLDGVTSAIQTQIDDKSTKAFAIAQAVALG